MFKSSLLYWRQAVALFNMKHFRSRQKYALTPANALEVFKSKLDSDDRMLRQSRLGSGATRVLIIDKHQRVKGVYHPLMCLPHPCALHKTENALGIPVKEWIDVLESYHKHTVEQESSHDFTMTILSHPCGFAITCFSPDGKTVEPTKNYSQIDKSVSAESEDNFMGESTVETEIPYTMKHIAENIREVLNTSYLDEYNNCTSIYYISRDIRYATAIFTPTSNSDTEEENEENDEEETKSINVDAKTEDMKTFPLGIKNNKWILIPDTILRAADFTPLYKRDPESNIRIVNPEGIYYAANNGLLELDVYVKSSDSSNVNKDNQHEVVN